MTLNEDFTFIHITDLSLTVHALMGHTEATVLDMTHLFQLTYLSNQLHLHIQDESEGQAYNEQLKLELLTPERLPQQRKQPNPSSTRWQQPQAGADAPRSGKRAAR